MSNYTLKEALAHAVKGEACLFLGAGFSTLFTDINSKALPTSGQLAGEMIAACEGRQTADLRVAATQLLKALGNEGYQEFLQQRFTVKDVAQAAVDIATERWARIYTTNFDDGFEKAAVSAGRKVLSVVPSDSIEQYLHSPRVCVHVHGFVDRVSPESIEQDLVLTLPGYASGRFLDSQWHSLLKHDLRAARFIFFVGYSLNDLDIARTLQQCGLDLATKAFFVVPKAGDSDLELMLEDFGTFCPIGVDGFAAALKSLDRTRLPPSFAIFDAFAELTIPSSPIRPSDADMYRLLMAGFLDERLLLSYAPAGDDVQYCVPRKPALQELGAGLSTEHPNLFAIVGELSNGKSVALYEGVRALLAAGFRCFILVDSSKNWSPELQRIFSVGKERVAIVIDDCSLRMSCVEDAFKFIRKGDVVLLADRTNRFDLIEDRLLTWAGKVPLIQMDVDQLDESERGSFVALLQRHGLWGDLAHLDPRHKDSIVHYELGNQIRGILLGVLRSPAAISRLKQSLEDVDFGSKQYDGLVMCLILVVTKAAELRQDIIDDLVDSVPLRRMLAGSQSARTLIELRSPNLIRTVSAVVAETILRQLVPLATIVRCIRTAVRRSVQFAISNEDKQFPKRIMQFRRIQQLLPDSESRSLESIEAIYDSIKTEAGFGNDPQFWLQYAICELFLRNFERAERYFSTAYSVCRPGYDKKFIDNHYARYLLESAVDGPGAPLPVIEAEGRANKAKSLLLPQFGEDVHYPYKVAAKFLQFVKMYRGFLTPTTCDGLLRFFSTVIEHARRASNRGNVHRYITQCRGDLEAARRLLNA